MEQQELNKREKEYSSITKLDFMKSSKEDQLKYLIEYKMPGYVLSLEFEYAEKLKNFLVKFQKKDFNLDNNLDLQSYMDMLRIIF